MKYTKSRLDVVVIILNRMRKKGVGVQQAFWG